MVNARKKFLNSKHRVTTTVCRYEAPSIAEAKAFARSNLPHRIRAPNQPTKYRLARPGEKKDENGEVQRND
jgi:hypothetical protein